MEIRIKQLVSYIYPGYLTTPYGMLKSMSQLTFILNTLALLTALVFSLIRKNKELRPIQIDLLYTVLFLITALFPGHTPVGKKTYNMMFNSSVVVDFSAFYYYFYSLMIRRSLRRWLVICFFAFTSLILYLWLGPMHAFDKFESALYGLENIFITIPCFFYFYEVFKSDDIKDFKTNPHFYVASGLLFFYATTFPFYISYKILYDVTPELFKGLIMVNNVLSIILYCTIIKAYLCPRPALK